jgi:peptidoglycan/LPS O-acetylase OafA/YrhL
VKFIADAAHGRDNNFNLVRMLAAAAVLVSHSWPIALGAGTSEPLESATGYKLGTTAVIIFFAISGFFIAKSFDRRKSFIDFLVARAFRLYPALIVLLVLTVIVLGPLFTRLQFSEYARDPHTAAYIPKNLSLYWLQWSLPGVFASNRYGPPINGSLWTLFWEVICYAMVVVVGLVGALKPIRFGLFLVAMTSLEIAIRWFGFSEPLTFFSLLSFPFIVGMTCYVYREWIPLSNWIILALSALAALRVGQAEFHMLYPLALSYGAIRLGFANLSWTRQYNRTGDYSYGMYLYAFPVQQSVIATLGALSPWSLTFTSLPITLALAMISWRYIEKPALSRRHSVGLSISRLLGSRWRAAQRFS